jgi:regulatory protein
MTDKDRRAPKVHQPRQPRPLEAASLSELALGYAARFATTEVRLGRYLQRKLRERGWVGEGEPDIAALVTRLAGLGYVDDRAWAAAKARDLGGRGFGARRVRGALAAAGVGREDRAAATGEDDSDSIAAAAWGAALVFARRRRFGPFAREPTASPGAADPARQRRELAAMVRAGHDPQLARRLLAARDPAEAEALAEAMAEG